MKTEIVITTDRVQREDQEAISLEKIIARRLARRRRVAKRMAKRCPLMAVEFMQQEFPGYTYEEWEADVTRKTRKGKSIRHPKQRAFDWKWIQKEIPDFFKVCVERTKTKAVLHGKTKDGNKFTCIVRSTWFQDQRQCRLHTHDLIQLWRGPLKTFVSHPAMLLYEHKNEFDHTQNTTT